MDWIWEAGTATPAALFPSVFGHIVQNLSDRIAERQQMHVGMHMRSSFGRGWEGGLNTCNGRQRQAVTLV